VRNGASSGLPANNFYSATHLDMYHISYLSKHFQLKVNMHDHLSLHSVSITTSEILYPRATLTPRSKILEENTSRNTRKWYKVTTTASRSPIRLAIAYHKLIVIPEAAEVVVIYSRCSTALYSAKHLIRYSRISYSIYKSLSMWCIRGRSYFLD
jgi:hypothetical protein